MADIDPILKTLIAEAFGEGTEGMRLVGETIVNRSQQRGIPPARVVAQPYQYTGYSNPGPAAQRAFNDPNAISAAQAAWQLAQGPGDPTGGANHYFAPGTISTPSWARSMTPTLTQGGHAFYTDRSGFQQQPMGPRVAPTPAQVTPSSAALRQMTSPSGGNTALQAALNKKALVMGNRVTPVTPEWLKGGMNAGDSIAMSPVQGGKQVSPLFNGQYSPQLGGMVRMNPAATGGMNPVDPKAARMAALRIGSNQTYAGQSAAGPQNLTPKLAGRVGPMTMAQAKGLYGAMGTQYKSPGPAMTVQQMYQGTGVQPLNYKSTPLPQARPLKTGPIMPLGANMRPKTSVPLKGTASFGKQAPVPLQRPNFGMGGPGFAPVNAASMAQVQAMSQVRPQPQLQMQPQMQFVPQPVPMVAVGPTALQRAGTQSLVGGNENNGPSLTSRGTILGSGPGFDDGSWARKK